MQIVSDPTASAGAAACFPPLGALTVRLPLESKCWTIWPGPAETLWDYVRGFPLELHPFAWDYVVVSCDGQRVELKPHYLESSFDTFWVDARGHVTCHALGGLFPFTLGRQPELLDGLRTTLVAVSARVGDPGTAKTIAQIAGQLGAIALELREIPEEVLRRELEEHWTRARPPHAGAPPGPSGSRSERGAGAAVEATGRRSLRARSAAPLPASRSCRPSGGAR